MLKPIWPLAMLAALAACGDKGTDDGAADRGAVTETVMDNVDDLEGTIGDDMIAIDDIRTTSPSASDMATGETDEGDTGADADTATSADGSPPADSTPDEGALDE